MDLIKSLNWRYATKAFDKERVLSEELMNQIEDSLVLSPSSFGLQPWKFLVITDDAIKEKLLPLSWNQTQVTECSHFIVLLAKTETTDCDIDVFLDSIAKTRSVSRKDLAQYEEMMKGFLGNMSGEQQFQWAKNQVYIALGQLLASAAILKVDACPMEGITPPEFDKILNIEGYQTVVACALGYRSTDDHHAQLAKVRFPKEDVIVYK